jgi:alanyl-tRNA synthetase
LNSGAYLLQEVMTEHLYYHDSFLDAFDAEVRELQPATAKDPRSALILDRTAFYPTSGGQPFDTGWIITDSTSPNAESQKLRVTEVVEREDGQIVHYLEPSTAESKLTLEKGSRVRGLIDPARRRDHMQQHSGQHILSAAFVRLFNLRTVSFHMGDEYCSIDLDTPLLTKEQVESAELLSNEIIQENRPVEVRNVTQDEASKLGLRKLPPAERDRLRLIDIRDFDLTACGGTHVRATGQVGCILLRKAEKARQGWRVEFVGGQRAVSTARRDFTTLGEAAVLFSSHLWELPQQVRKSLDEIRSLRKQLEHSREELAAAFAESMLAAAVESNGRKLIVRNVPDRDLAFVKLLAQKLTRQSSNAIALLATTSAEPALVFAQSPGLPFEMATLMKQTTAKLGGRGGGSKDMAQGGVPTAAGIEAALSNVAALIRAVLVA